MFSVFLKNKEKIYSLLIYFIVFLSSVFPYGDKDWGWHYKYGEYLLRYGKILTSDIYSWTLPGYQWINHSWMYDPLLYILTNLFGFVGLSLIGAFVNLLTFYLISSIFRLSYWKKAILAGFFILIGETGIMFGLRSQVVSTLFFAILMYILVKARVNIKLLFFLPVLFLVWVNFHGDFTLGLAILGVFLGSYFILNFYETKKIDKKRLIIYGLTGIISFAVTFINPFTYHVYLESLRHFSNPYLKNVYEWDPIYQSCPYCHASTFFIYLAILIACFVFYIIKKKYYALPFIIITAMLTWITIDTRRFLPIFVVITLPLLADFLRSTKINLTKYKVENILAIVAIIIALQFNLYNRFTSYNLYNFTNKDFCAFASGCSEKAVNYLVSHPPKGKGFNFYDWGGYLIGKNIPAKLFVDGRMHLWKDNNYTPFGDYISIYYDKDFNKFKQYNFDWVFIQTDSILSEQLLKGTLGKWKLEFQDGNSAYFVRIK